jgi:hypothetical protein
MKMENQKGFGIPEFLIASGIALAAIVALSQGLAGIWKTHVNFTDRKERELELVRAIQDVLRVGRTAQWCLSSLETTTGIHWLECSVDRNIPPTEDATDDSHYRFGLTPKGFVWQEMKNGQFETIMVYLHIVDFEICGDDSCTFSDAITQQHAKNIIATTFPTERDRFFRIRMGVPHELQEFGQTRFLQSAFYVRHPNPEKVFYGWGQRNE